MLTHDRRGAPFTPSPAMLLWTQGLGEGAEPLCPCLWQELFQKCHPVHFLNSRALGIVDKSVAVPR